MPEEKIQSIESVLTIVGGKIVHATEEFTPQAPSSIPVWPEWSPVKVFGGYGAPLDVRKAARAGVPVVPPHGTEGHQHGCARVWREVFTAAEAAQIRYGGLWGMGCDCFAF